MMMMLTTTTMMIDFTDDDGDDILTRMIMIMVMIRKIPLTPSKRKENLFAFGGCRFGVEDFHKHQVKHDSLQCHPSK